jgi:hypothetical protein
MNTYRIQYTDTGMFYSDVRATNAQTATCIGRAAVAADSGCLADDESLMSGYTCAGTDLVAEPDNVINN